MPSGRLNITSNDEENPGTGHLEMSGGLLFARDYFHWDGTATAHITGGLMALTDDRVSRINSYIAAGTMTTDPGLSIVAEWDPNWAWPSVDGQPSAGVGATLVYVVPEPAALALRVLGALPMLRRRR